MPNDAEASENAVRHSIENRNPQPRWLRKIMEINSQFASNENTDCVLDIRADTHCLERDRIIII